MSPRPASSSLPLGFLLRRSSERGFADHGWLKARHSFSFADYLDEAWMGFRALRVLNQDVIAGGRGFGMHPHRDMEIFTWMLDGALQHRDSMGSSSTIRPGGVQAMSAGTGVLHSETNASASEPAHLLQIWVLPHTQRVAPRYVDATFPLEERRNRLRRIIAGHAPGSPIPHHADDGALALHADIDVATAVLSAQASVQPRLKRGHAWIQIARGEATVQHGEVRIELGPGDGLGISPVPPGELRLAHCGDAETEVLVFDLA